MSDCGSFVAKLPPFRASRAATRAIAGVLLRHDPAATGFAHLRSPLLVWDAGGARRLDPQERGSAVTGTAWSRFGGGEAGPSRSCVTSTSCLTAAASTFAECVAVPSRPPSATHFPCLAGLGSFIRLSLCLLLDDPQAQQTGRPTQARSFLLVTLPR